MSYEDKRRKGTGTRGRITRKDRKKKTWEFETIEDLFIDLADILRPPLRIKVSDAAEKIRRLHNAGSYIGKWSNDMAPYLAEPMDILASRQFDGACFVGPAQCGKTEITLNWMAYSIKFDPMDMILYCPTQNAARDFSTRRVGRMHTVSKEVGAELRVEKDADNKFDKHYKSGMILNLSYPSVTEFAGRPIPRVAMTDYDRMDDDIEDDGTPYDLASKRTTSFGSYKMTFAESSPSRPVIDPKWIKSSVHEAPPCKGILSIYNRGDMRRWYWPCPHCGKYFEGQFEHLKWDNARSDNLKKAMTVYMKCPLCDLKILPSQREDMQAFGLWLKDGEYVDEDGRVRGKPRKSNIASFWLNGVAAAFTTWQNLVLIFLNATDTFERTGNESDLIKVYNTDIGVPYLPKNVEDWRLPHILKKRAESFPILRDQEHDTVSRDPTDLRPRVPEWVRFLIAAVDVQKNMFVVQVFGISPGEPFDLTVVDNFKIVKSKRLDHDGERLWVKPGTQLDDWDEIRTQVMLRQYELADDSGRHMTIKLTVCDAYGQPGVTTNAYDFYRQLRQQGLSTKFHLVKGDPNPKHPQSQIVFPDSNRKDKFSVARGDVPVLLMNSNEHKDHLNWRLQEITPGKGMIRYPNWLRDSWFSEMCIEIRTEKGWINKNSYRNEAWDLTYYALAVARSALLKVHMIDWASPPTWAEGWNKNELIVKGEDKERFAKEMPLEVDFSALGKRLAG